MRTLLAVIAAVLLFIGVGIGGVLTWRDFNDAGALSQARAQLGSQLGQAGQQFLDKAMSERGVGGVTASDLQVGGAAAGVASALGLAVLVLVFSNRSGLVMKLAGGLVLLAGVLVVANPQWDEGLTGPASARKIAMIAAVPLVLGAIAALLVARMKAKAGAS